MNIQIPQAIAQQLEKMHSSIGIEYHEGNPRGFVIDNFTGHRYFETPIKDKDGKIVVFKSEEDCLEQTVEGAMKIGAPKTLSERAAESAALNGKLAKADAALKQKDEELAKLQAQLDALKAGKSGESNPEDKPADQQPEQPSEQVDETATATAPVRGKKR